MSITVKTMPRIVFAALPLLVLGCTQRTTQEDVQAAREDVAEEQQDVDEARHEAMKPTIDADDAEDIQEEKQDVAEAQATLDRTENEAAATQARDAFALEAQKVLDSANRDIEALETRAGGEEGAVKEATERQIDDLKSKRDRLDQAIDDMNGADLLAWSNHRDSVQQAMQDVADALRMNATPLTTR
jgi:hypothetical protein